MNTNMQSVTESEKQIISKASQFSSLAEGSNIEINSTVDLDGKEVVLPGNCSVFFSGGAIKNGTLTGNNTSLYGDVKVERLAGSFATPVRASYLTSGGFSDLLSLLGLNTKTVILDEDYSLPVTSVQSISCPYIKYLIGEDIVIDITGTGDISTSPFYLINASELKYLGGITFNGGHKRFKGFLWIRNGAQNSIAIENVTVNNITNPVSTSFIRGINIDKYNNVNDLSNVRDCRITVRNVRMCNLLQRGNGTITEAEGSVTGLQVYIDAGSSVDVRIDSCRFNEIHCFGSGGTSDLLYEDAAGLFVFCSFWNNYAGEPKTSVDISNIQGHNFGKRLVKTDCANVSVRNVFGTNEYTDFLCLVGLNNSDSRFKYASVKNIHYEGVVGFSTPAVSNGSYTLGTSMRFTTAENIISKVTGITPRTPGTEETGTNYPFFYPASINADDVTLRNVHMLGAQTVYLPNNKNIKYENVTYDDTEGVINSYSCGIFMPRQGASAVINGLKVKAYHKPRLIACNYRDENFTSSDIFINNADLEFAQSPSTSIYQTAIIEGQDWESGNLGHRLDLTIKNCIVRHAENFIRFPLRKYKGQWTLENIKFIYDSIPTADNHICLGGYFNIYNDINESLTLKDITITGPTTFNKSGIQLINAESGTLGTQVHLSNIRSNCTTYDVYTANVCWGEYIDATVNRYQSNLFGAAQKGFMVKDYSAGVKYVWNGTAWVVLTV